MAHIVCVFFVVYDERSVDDEYCWFSIARAAEKKIILHKQNRPRESLGIFMKKGDLQYFSHISSVGRFIYELYETL